MAIWDNWFNTPQQPAQAATAAGTGLYIDPVRAYATNPTAAAAYGIPQPAANPYSTWGQVASTSQPVAGRVGGTYPTGTQATNPYYSAPTTSGFGQPDIYSTGGYDVYNNPLSISNPWEVLGRTQTQESTAMTEYQRAMINLQLQQLAKETGMSDAELDLERRRLEAEIANQNAQLAWSKEQWGQQQAQEQKNYLANLAAEPHSWLEYAAAAGQAPVIQPWMLPLMPQDYGATAGATIPGWNPTNMTGIPELTNPSTQYQARMGPTAQQQYYGYEQARTGSTPEEAQWRLWSMAPPGGGRGLTQVR